MYMVDMGMVDMDMVDMGMVDMDMMDISKSRIFLAQFGLFLDWDSCQSLACGWYSPFTQVMMGVLWAT